MTNNLERRLNEHNNGYNKSTKARIPFIIKYYEEFEVETEAYKREKKIKSYKGGQAFKNLLE